jgi:pilus assembly protein Flp/PilA
MWNDLTARVSAYVMTLYVTAKEQEGQALVEYGLLVGLIAVVCIVAITALGGKINDYFNSIVDAL